MPSPRPSHKIPTYSELDTVHPGRHLNGLATFSDGLAYRFVWNKSHAGETTVTLYDPAHPGVRKLYAPQRAEFVREDCDTRPDMHAAGKANMEAREASYNRKQELETAVKRALSLREELAWHFGDRQMLVMADLFISDALSVLSAFNAHVAPTGESLRAHERLTQLRAVLDAGDAAKKELDRDFPVRNR